MTLRPAVALIATVSVLALTVPASAAGYQVRENSAAYQGTAFAGQASGNQDLSVMFANPATMTQFSGSRIEGNGTEVNGGSLAFVPAIYGMTSITPDLKAGLSITVPYGLATNYAPDWVGRY